MTGRGVDAIARSPAGGGTARAGPPRDSLNAILARDATRAVFQPIIELDSGAVVGFEALARGPAGSPLARPAALFDAARAGDLIAELDWTCRATAFGAALDGGLGDELTLFVNVEPGALDAPCPSRYRQVYESARAGLRVAIEITESALTERPAELLAAVGAAREQGWGVALDDIGADRRSLALMPLLRPDVLKLDLRLVQQRPSPEAAEIVNAVAAQAERTGATVLAEGIETDEQVTRARSLGATLGQGWHFGHPAPLGEVLSSAKPGPVLPLAAPPSPRGLTPFEIVTSARRAREGDVDLLAAVSRELERQAEAIGDTALVLAGFHDAAVVGEETLALYERLSERLAFVGMLGVGVDETPAAGIRSAQTAPDNPSNEWDVAVVGPHFAAALAARHVGGAADQTFQFAVTHDRDLAVECARLLMARIGERSRPGPAA